MIGISAIGVLMPFFCMEAMHDTAVVGVEASLRSYVIYYCTIVPLKRDSRTGERIPATRTYLAKKLRSVVIKMVIIVLLLNILDPVDYVPFQEVPTPEDSSWPWLSSIYYQYFHWTHLANNFSTAFLMCQCIDVGDEQFGLIVALMTGSEAIDVMRNPMLLSTSATDFWSNRWNMTMHGSFKRGIVKPLMRRGDVPRWVAVLGTFVVSGLLHEYICQVIQAKSIRFPGIAKDYVANIGNQLCFFVWNGGVVVLERLVFPKGKMTNRSVWPLNTMLVLLTVLPVSHWFTDEYLRSGFYNDVSLGLPLFVYKSRNTL
jgi:hypothetical protein